MKTNQVIPSSENNILSYSCIIKDTPFPFQMNTNIYFDLLGEKLHRVMKHFRNISEAVAIYTLTEAII